jgi:hypothetical protein
MIWYHGSPERFEGFRTYNGHTFGEGSSEVPLFFSPCRSFAKLYATGPSATIYAVNLTWTKIFDAANLYRDHCGCWPPEYEDLTTEGKRLYDDLSTGNVFPGIDDDDMIDGYLWEQVLRMDYDIIEDTAFKAWLVNNGYDASYITGDGEKNIFVFSENQVEIVNTASVHDK